MKPAAHNALVRGLRWVLGMVFILAAISKLANLQDFYATVTAYRFPFPDLLLQVTAMILPWLELLCGLLLLADVWTRAALIWVAILCAIFIVATGQAWARGLDISCGCIDLHLLGFGHGSGSTLAGILESLPFAFFRGIAMAAAVAYLLRRARLENAGLQRAH